MCVQRGELKFLIELLSKDPASVNATDEVFKLWLFYLTFNLTTGGKSNRVLVCLFGNTTLVSSKVTQCVHYPVLNIYGDSSKLETGCAYAYVTLCHGIL